MTEIWLVTNVDPDDNQEGIIGDALYGGPLMASDQRRLDQHVRPYVNTLRRLEPDQEITIKHFVLVDES